MIIIELKILGKTWNKLASRKDTWAASQLTATREVIHKPSLSIQLFGQVQVIRCPDFQASIKSVILLVMKHHMDNYFCLIKDVRPTRLLIIR